ncbi:MAG: branched-chain amino acid ABC transporter permease [Actinobacteria bacterium]|nr:branched-chain amino acid ABC transporter permease [Actinomycetota bacterium]
MKINNLSTTRWVGLGLLLVVLVVLVLLPTITEGYLPVLVTDILKFVILTVAWVLFAAPTGYMSLATGAFYGLGFYIAAVFNGPVPFPIVIIIAGIAGFVVALLVGALTLRLRAAYFCIFTFALVLLISNVVLEVERLVTQTRGRFVETETVEAAYYAMLIIAVLTLVVAWLIRRSRHGLALQSIGEHEEAAAHSGINVTRTKVLVFAVSSVFMGMAGAIIATRRAYIDPGIAFSMNNTFLPVLMAMFGGMGNLLGPVIGAAIFTYIGELLLTRFPDLYMLIFGVVLILAILFMPNGILGLGQQIWAKLRGGRRAPA